MMARIARLILLGTLFTAGCQSKPPYKEKSAAELEAMLHKDDATTQVQGAIGLGELGPEARTAVPALAEALKSKDVLLRESAARALAQIGPDAKAAVPTLTEALRDPEWTVRRQAVLALAAIGPDARPALPSLEKLTRDPDHLVRQAAQEAVKKLRQLSIGKYRVFYDVNEGDRRVIVAGFAD